MLIAADGKRLRAGAAFAATFVQLFVAAPNALAQQHVPDTTLLNGGVVKEHPNRNYNSLAIGPWLFQPNLFVGGLFDSNINSTQTGKIAGYGERVVSSFTGNLNNGIHRTDIYGQMDGRFYQAREISNARQISAKSGFVQTYEARRDLVFSVSGDYTRQQNAFGSFPAQQSNAPQTTTTTETTTTTTPPPPPPTPTTPVPPPVPTTTTAASTPVSQNNQVFYNVLSGATSMRMSFSHASLSTGFSAQYTKFDHGVGTTLDGTAFTVPVRASIYVTPQAYLFTDSSIYWRDYTTAMQTSNGRRLTAGLGTDQGIWLIEIYGGRQDEDHSVLGRFGGDVIGALIIYSPTPLWTLRGTFDESVSIAAISNGPNLINGSASRITSTNLLVTYSGLPVQWSTQARMAFVRTAALDAPRVDDAWFFGFNISYLIWRNLSATLDYQFTKYISNVANQSFDKHQVSLGMSYRY